MFKDDNELLKTTLLPKELKSLIISKNYNSARYIVSGKIEKLKLKKGGKITKELFKMYDRVEDYLINKIEEDNDRERVQGLTQY